MCVSGGDEAAGPTWWPLREAVRGGDEVDEEEGEVAPFAAASVSRPAFSGGVAVRTGTGSSTSGGRTTRVTVTSTVRLLEA